jgi:hypothetical protein
MSTIEKMFLQSRAKTIQTGTDPLKCNCAAGTDPANIQGVLLACCILTIIVMKQAPHL